MLGDLAVAHAHEPSFDARLAVPLPRFEILKDRAVVVVTGIAVDGGMHCFAADVFEPGVL